MQMYKTADEDALRERIAEASGNPDVKIWRCPCETAECVSRVYYARAGADNQRPNHVYFAPNVGFTQHGYEFGIENVEDLQLLLSDQGVDPNDRMMFALWLELGLREDLLDAPAKGATE